MHIEGTVRRRNLISLTPLIDVVFILLVFFMLASNFTQIRAIGVSVPADTTASTSDAPTLLLRVFPDGRLELDGGAVALEALREQVRSRAGGRPVLVQPVGETRLQALVAVLDRLAGIPKVSLARE